MPDSREARPFEREMNLDTYGRCCGRKPLVYKRPPHRFCSRCDRAYHITENQQIDNWAWRNIGPLMWERKIG